jgi:metal-dependent amidase/aminoacylase/carboxypeptidase family protein
MDKLEEELESWTAVAGLHYSIEVNSGTVRIHVTAPGGHISEVGANVEYVNALIVTTLDQAGVKWKKGNIEESSSIAGTVRLKNKEWKRKGKDIIGKIEQIVAEEATRAGFSFDTKGSVVVPPVENDPQLRRIASDFITNTPIQRFFRLGEERLLAGYAEPFSFWQQLLHAKALLLWIGTGDPDVVRKNRESALPAMRLHNEEMVVSLDAIPYIGIMGLLAFQIGREWT